MHRRSDSSNICLSKEPGRILLENGDVKSHQLVPFFLNKKHNFY